MTENLTIGFLPLVDACLPILAHEHGFAEEDIALQLARDQIAGERGKPPAVLQKALSENDFGGCVGGSLVGHG